MRTILLTFMSFTSLFCFSQYGNKDGNRIGISAGITQTNLYNTSLQFSPGFGWIAGLSVRGNFYNDNWSMIFGMQFLESKFSLDSSKNSKQNDDITYTLSGVQIRVLGSYHLIGNNLALDFGPVLQVNGKLKIADSHNSIIINQYGLKAQDITDISKINANVYVGLSGGGRRLRANLCYQYGLTNLFGNLNGNNELLLNNNNKNNFKANLGLVSGQLTFNL